jgi:hypothetical protein
MRIRNLTSGRTLVEVFIVMGGIRDLRKHTRRASRRLLQHIVRARLHVRSVACAGCQQKDTARLQTLY